MYFYLGIMTVNQKINCSKAPDWNKEIYRQQVNDTI